MDKTIEKQEIFQLFDHTCLDVTATIDDITKLCGEAVKYNAATVCVPPCYVKQAVQFIGRGKTGVCTVIGYPNGYSTTETKLFECKNAIKNGAHELEIYANIGHIRKRQYDDIQKELAELRKISKNKVLKLIIDTAILSPDEQIAVCTIAASAQIDYISVNSEEKFDDLVATLKRLKDGLGERARIKIAGDIETVAQAEALYAAGANRIGESKVLPMVESMYFVNVDADKGEIIPSDGDAAVEAAPEDASEPDNAPGDEDAAPEIEEGAETPAEEEAEADS